MSEFDKKSARNTRKGEYEFYYSAKFLDTLAEVLIGDDELHDEKDILEAARKAVANAKNAKSAGEENKELKKQIGDLQKQVKELTDEKAKAVAGGKKAGDTIKDLEAKVKGLEEGKATLEKEKAELQAKVDELQNGSGPIRPAGDGRVIDPSYLTDKQKEKLSEAAAQMREAIDTKSGLAEGQDDLRLLLSLM